MKKNIFLIIAVAIAVVLTSCGGGKQQLPTSNEYPTITIGASNAQLNTTYPATIKGIQDVQVRPKVSGFITKLNVHEGQYVRAGQVQYLMGHSNASVTLDVYTHSSFESVERAFEQIAGNL